MISISRNEIQEFYAELRALEERALKWLEEPTAEPSSGHIYSHDGVFHVVGASEADWQYRTGIGLPRGVPWEARFEVKVPEGAKLAHRASLAWVSAERGQGKPSFRHNLAQVVAVPYRDGIRLRAKTDHGNARDFAKVSDSFIVALMFSGYGSTVGAYNFQGREMLVDINASLLDYESVHLVLGSRRTKDYEPGTNKGELPWPVGTTFSDLVVERLSA